MSNVTTFQPFVLVTTDVEVARKFTLLKNQSLTFSQINAQIDSEVAGGKIRADAILLSPTKNNHYFESFDYNIGYDSGEVFSINLNFLAIDSFFEDFFVKFVFNEEKYRKVIETDYIKKKKEFYSKGYNFPNLNSLNVNENLKTVNYLVGKKVENFCYFVFGINDKHNTPIVSQFRYCEVIQSNQGFRKLKANFTNLGHPGKLSELALLNIKEPDVENIEVHEQQSYKIAEAYTYKDKIDISLLPKERKFSKFIRKVLKNLFYEVTGGQDIILLLPDFDKLYDKFIKDYTPPLKIRAIESGANSHMEIATKLTSSKLVQFFRAAEFLRALGFNIESDVYKKIQERENSIPSEVVKQLKDFEEDTRGLKQDLASFGLDDDAVGILLNNPSRLNDRLDPVFSQIQTRNDKDTIRSLIKNYNDRRSDYLDLILSIDPKIVSAKNTGSLGVGAGAGLAVAGDPLTQFINNSNQEFLKQFEVKNVSKEGAVANQLAYFDPDQTEKIQKATATIDLEFKIIKNGKDNSTSLEVLPTKGNHINFYKFLSELSNNIAKIEKNIPIRIKFYEENDLRRLELIQKFCSEELFDLGIMSIRKPLIYSSERPALVIGDEFLIKQLIYPITTTKIKWDNSLFSFYQEDIDNFGVNSKYFKELQKYRAILNNKYNKGFMNSSFSEKASQDILNILNQNNDYKDKLPLASPLFICNDARANVMSYELEVDKLNHNTAYRSLVEYSQKVILNDSLNSIRRDFYDQIFNVPKIVKEMEGYLADDMSLDDIINKLGSRINQGEFSKAPISDNGLPSTTFSPEQGALLINAIENNADFQAEMELGRQRPPRLVDFLLTDLYQDFIRANSGTKLSVTTDIFLNPILKRKQVLNDLYKKLFKVRVKTVPFFEINNMERLYSGAFFIVRNIIQPNSTLIENQEFSYLTGLYFILGFRHVISTTAAYSEFNLCKDIDTDGPQT